MDMYAHSIWAASNGWDALVIVILIRGFMSLLLSILFFIEPSCRGKNRTVHWMLGILFGIGALSAWDRALSRMSGLIEGRALTSSSFITSEIAFVICGWVLIGIVVYQHFRDKTMVEHSLPTICDTCDKYPS